MVRQEKCGELRFGRNVELTTKSSDSGADAPGFKSVVIIRIWRLRLAALMESNQFVDI